jgi:hypothetical protein
MSNTEFTPVPLSRARQDGWTEERQRAFIEALSTYGIVTAAAQQVGMSASTAYRLREREGAESFAAAWETAVKIGMAQLQDIAMDRAINGVAVPVFYKGEQVGERRWFDNRMLRFLLAQTNTRRFGPLAAQFDYVDEALAVEAATERRKADQLARAKALLAAIEEDLEELGADDESEEGRALDETRDRLEELVAKLGAVDSYNAEIARLDEMVATGRMTLRTANKFKQRKSAQYLA